MKRQPCSYSLHDSALDVACMGRRRGVSHADHRDAPATLNAVAIAMLMCLVA